MGCKKRARTATSLRRPLHDDMVARSALKAGPALPSARASSASSTSPSRPRHREVVAWSTVRWQHPPWPAGPGAFIGLRRRPRHRRHRLLVLDTAAAIAGWRATMHHCEELWSRSTSPPSSSPPDGLPPSSHPGRPACSRQGVLEVAETAWRPTPTRGRLAQLLSARSASPSTTSAPATPPSARWQPCPSTSSRSTLLVSASVVDPPRPCHAGGIIGCEQALLDVIAEASKSPSSWTSSAHRLPDGQGTSWPAPPRAAGTLLPQWPVHVTAANAASYRLAAWPPHMLPTWVSDLGASGTKVRSAATSVTPCLRPHA